MTTPVKKTIGNGKPGPGRPKGIPNKATTALKDMILGALGDNGGQAYLAVQARENPTAFLTLLGKVLPMQVAGENGEALGIVIFKGLNENG
jgi:hypothetical protein